MDNLMQYYSNSDESDTEEPTLNFNDTTHLKPPSNETCIKLVNKRICSAPSAVSTGLEEELRVIDSSTKEINYNLPYEELFAPENGPIHPDNLKKKKIEKNMLSGYVEATHLSDFQFENQRRNFVTLGYALDPTEGTNIIKKDPIYDFIDPLDDSVPSVPDNTEEPKTIEPKRKRMKNDNPSDIDNFLGPWGGYVNEKKISKPSDEEYAELQELLAKKHKRGKNQEEKSFDEKSVLHIKDSMDYQGRSFLHPPQDVGVNLKSDMPPDRCFLPKRQIHTWSGHLKGISAIRWFPRSAHLLLSASMDCRVKLWEVYNQRRCVRTYYGHDKAVRDVCFNNSGEHFLSAAYDKYIKLWDTETGQCISRFTSRKIPYCVKFNPDNEKQNLFVAGTSDKKIICWDVRSNDIVQEYDRHLAAVNTITFVDENRRFVTTSDDKSLRVWEWDIPVDMKYIADPTMHSMPAVTLSPNQKWLACQSMDNKIVIFSALNRFKLNRNKVFTGHMVAGYACSIDFSPDMSYLYSGDADGKCYIWDWKTTKLYKKWKAHNSVCISTLCHPHEASKVVTAGWDGEIKYWD